ncbi:MAG: hypothetical protein BroJett015_47680 [Chloroflexota bacterium]|nr:MAG: hypothetical protein BroJett015_47680 [Chloroflexota bacterium]
MVNSLVPVGQVGAARWGHRPQPPAEDRTRAESGSAWEGEWDLEQQQANQEQAYAVMETGAELACGVWDPCDIGYTGYRIGTGQAGTLETAAIALPIVPGIVGRLGDEAVGLIGKFWDEAADLVRAGCSFSAETLVMTEDGLVPISEVSLETLVLAYNEETGEIGYYPVVAIWSHEDPVIVFLTIDGETIVTTPNHPFFTAEGEWEQAANLQPGDEIRDAAWGTGTVEAITFTATPQTMYNFTVAAAHTYSVGDGQWLVHNDCKLPTAVSDFLGNHLNEDELRSLYLQMDLDYERMVPRTGTHDDAVAALVTYVEKNDVPDQFYRETMTYLGESKYSHVVIQKFRDAFWLGE